MWTASSSLTQDAYHSVCVNANISGYALSVVTNDSTGTGVTDSCGDFRPRRGVVRI